MRSGKGIWPGAFGLFCITQCLCAPPAQVVLDDGSRGNIGAQQDEVVAAQRRPLHGRFLHITDFHPDRFYELYSSTAKDDACHSGTGPAGVYGAEMSDCDSPVALINKTMQWIGKHLKDEIDFIIWTGDSARHDNDEEHPRTESQVVGLNEFMVEKFKEAFGKNGHDKDDPDPNNHFVVPIVPSFGNNDILPHNIFTHGPNKWTRIYGKLWRQFVPEAQRHQFEQGGWFFVEVIPNKLAVFSLNTMYFFTSNSAVDGCAKRSEPGYQQMEWLRIQLDFIRQRGMKAILVGHVPPARTSAKTSWDETCWQKYTLWLRQYRDVVVSSHYGHFNYDHFILQDFEDLRKGTRKGRMPEYKTETLNPGDGEMHAMVSPDYFIELRNEWSTLPHVPKTSLDVLVDDDLGEDNGASKKHKKRKNKKPDESEDDTGGEYAERFAVSYVAASVVPNLFPALRVFEYNITGLGDDIEQHVTPRLELRDVANMKDLEDESEEYDDDDDDDEYVQNESMNDLAKKHKKKRKHKKKHRKPKKNKFTIPYGPSKSSPPGPAYSPQTFSLLKYTQYLANLTHINNDFPLQDGQFEPEVVDPSKWHEGKHRGQKPHDKDYKPKPNKFEFEVQYETQDDDVYQLTDLTMPTMLDLARRVGGYRRAADVEDDADDESEVDVEGKKHHKKNKKRKQDEAWFTFVRRAFVETLTREEIEEEFG